VVPVVLYAVAALVTWRLPVGPVRRFCASLLVFDVISTVGFLAYTAVGIDALSQYYIGYFYWSAPVIVALVIVLGVVELLSAWSWMAVAVAVTAAAVACAAFAVAPQTRTSTNHTDPADLTTGANTDPALPAGVARLAALSHGRPIVLKFTHDAWPEVTGFLVQAERTGVTACAADPGWEFMLTSQFICTPAQLRNGVTYRLYPSGEVPHGLPVLFRLRRALVTGTGKGT
jgi:hypothetical protein